MCIRDRLALTETQWEQWLDDKQGENSLLKIMQSTQPAWTVYQVSSRVNSTRNNDPDVLIAEKGKQSLLF